MEWLFFGSNRIIPMEYTNSSWNDALFTCYDEMTNETDVLLKVKGETYSITVTVYHVCIYTAK